MHIVKTLFYCILIKVYKRPEPAGGRGLRSGWMEGRQVASWLPWLLLFAFSRLGLFFLCWGGEERKQVEKGTREPQEEIKTSDPDPRKFVTQMEIKLETQQRERTAG